MKILFVIIFLSCFYPTFSQNKFEFKGENKAFKEVISSLETQYNINFSYLENLVSNKKITSNCSSNSLSSFISCLTANTNLDFEIIDNNYVILKKKAIPLISIKGHVKDSLSNENLGYAIIQIKETGLATYTDINGNFKLKGAIKYNQTVVIRNIGYKDFEVPVKDFIKNPGLSIQLSANFLKTLVVKEFLTHGIDLAEYDNFILLSPQELKTLPGNSNPDIIKTTQFIPGINATDERSTNINIRGGTPDHNYLSYDNIPIYHGGHFFGVLSSIYPYNIDKVKIYRSGLTANYGGKIGGGIDIYSISEIPDSVETELGLNLMYADANIKIPLVKNKLALMLSGRSSYLNLLPTLETSKYTNLVFQGSKVNLSDTLSNYEIQQYNNNFRDVYGKLIFTPNDKNHISLSTMFVYNDLVYNANEIYDTDTVNNRDYQTLDNFGFNLNWNKVWNKKWNSKLSITQSYFRSVYELDIILDNDSLLGQKSNSINDFTTKLGLNYTLNNNNTIDFGYQFTRHDFNYHLSFNNSFFANDNFEENDTTKANINSIYGQYKFNKNKFYLNTGVRASHYNQFNEFYFEPRFAIKYKLNNHYNFKFNAGLYHQFLSQIVEIEEGQISLGNQVWVLSNDEGVPVLNSSQIATGFTFSKNGWRFDIEAYYKEMTGITGYSNNLNTNVNNDNLDEGEGRSKGLDLLVKKQLGKYRVWLNYSLSNTEYSFDENQDNYFQAHYNQKHILNAITTYSYKKFDFSIGWKIASGLPFTKATNLIYTLDPVENIYNVDINYGNRNADQLKPYHRLDLTAVYNFTSKSGNLKGSLSFGLLNIYNRRNELEKFYSIKEDDNFNPILVEQTKVGLGITPSFSYRINF